MLAMIQSHPIDREASWSGQPGLSSRKALRLTCSVAMGQPLSLSGLCLLICKMRPDARTWPVPLSEKVCRFRKEPSYCTKTPVFLAE